MTAIVKDQRARDMIAARLQSVANEVCRGSLKFQEPQITSRIGQALESELRSRGILGYRVRVITHDIPDRGRGSLEHSLGADMYMGFELNGGGSSRSKGILIQAKKGVLSSPGQIRATKKQCSKMLARTKHSYVWSYTEMGITSQEAESYSQRGPLARRNPIADTFSGVLECTKGDPELGLPATKDMGETREALDEMLKELAVETAVAVVVDAPNHEISRRL